MVLWVEWGFRTFVCLQSRVFAALKNDERNSFTDVFVASVPLTFSIELSQYLAASALVWFQDY